MATLACVPAARAQLLIASAIDRGGKVGAELVSYYTSHSCRDAGWQELTDEASTVLSMISNLRAVGVKEKSFSYQDSADLQNAAYALQLRLDSMYALPPCPPRGGGSPKFGPRPSVVLGPTTPSTSTVAAAPTSPYTIEASAYGGGLSATSFGSNYSPGVVGGRAAVSMPYGNFRFQADIQGERSDQYARGVGSRAYSAGGAHFAYMVMPGTEIGLFGGAQTAQPTFMLSSNTNYFVGLEGRQFFGPAVVGVQLGRFDTIDKPGTFTDAWFAEGRGTFSIGRAAGLRALDYTLLGANLGYAAGKASLTSTDAQTAYWGVQVSQGFADWPVSVFLSYQHFENRVTGLGTVWKEDMIVGGIKVLLPSTQTERLWLEPTRPSPYLLRTVTNF